MKKSILLVSLMTVSLMTFGQIGILPVNISHPEDEMKKNETEQVRYNFIRPYIKDWFIDLLPSDRGLAELLNLNIRQFMGNDTICNIYISVNNNYERRKPDFTLSYEDKTNPQDRKITKCFYMVYDNEANSYSALNQVPFTTPMFMPQSLSTIKESGFDIMFFDLNGDGLQDIIQVGDTIRKQQVTFDLNAPTHFYDLRVLINTGFGYVPEKDLAKFVYDFRVGYVGGYYLGFNNALNPTPNQDGSPTAPQNPGPSSTVSSPIAQGQPTEQELSIESKYLCSNYEDLRNRKFLDANRNQILFVGLKAGYSDGDIDGMQIKLSSAKFTNTTNKFSAASHAITTMADTIIFANHLVDYNNDISEFTNKLLELPLYRITLKNKKTGATIPLNDVYNSDGFEMKKISNSESSLTAFVQKINRPVFQNSAPFFKPLDTNSDWYICNPSVLCGQISAYLSILTIVNNPEFLKTIPNNNFDAAFWTDLRNKSLNRLMPYTSQEIQAMSKSLPGIFALEFREGYRDISSYIDKANSEISVNLGREQATNEIIDFLKQQFPDFRPQGNIATPAQAKVEIARFVTGLYAVIKELEITITKLNNQIDELSKTNKLLQETLTNANNRIQELQGVIAKLDSAAGNLDRTLNLVANTAEVAYWGSSVGVVHSVGEAVGNFIGGLF